MSPSTALLIGTGTWWMSGSVRGRIKRQRKHSFVLHEQRPTWSRRGSRLMDMAHTPEPSRRNWERVSFIVRTAI